MAKQRSNAKQAPSKADRVFLAMQKPLKRAAKSIVKDQRRSDREKAAREKARQAELASEPEVPPYPGLDSLEVQTRFAMNTITLARVALLAGECVDSGEPAVVGGGILDLAGPRAGGP